MFKVIVVEQGGGARKISHPCIGGVVLRPDAACIGRRAYRYRLVPAAIAYWKYKIIGTFFYHKAVNVTGICYACNGGG